MGVPLNVTAPERDMANFLANLLEEVIANARSIVTLAPDDKWRQTFALNPLPFKMRRSAPRKLPFPLASQPVVRLPMAKPSSHCPVVLRDTGMSLWPPKSSPGGANCLYFPACLLAGTPFASSFLVPNRGVGEVAGDPRLEFNEAVRECLASCYRTDLPVAALAEYVEVLKRRDWTPSEIHKVEAAVLKILLAVVSKDERDDLVNRIIKPRDSRAAGSGDEAKEVAPGAKRSNKSQYTDGSGENGGDKLRSSGNRASGSVLPAHDFSRAGDGAAKRL
jgi:hypothetical protein